MFHCRIVILIGKKLCPVIHAANLHIAHADRSELFIQDIGTVSCAVHPAFHNLFRGFLSPGNIFAGASVADALLLQRRTEISSVRSGMGKGRLDFNRPYLCGRLYVLINLQRGQACFCTFLIYQPCHLGSKGKLGFIILRSIISRISARFFLVGLSCPVVLIRLLIRLLIRFALVRLIGSRLILIRRAVIGLSRIRLAAVRLSCILIAAGVPGNVSQGGMITGSRPTG